MYPIKKALTNKVRLCERSEPQSKPFVGQARSVTSLLVWNDATENSFFHIFECPPQPVLAALMFKLVLIAYMSKGVGLYVGLVDSLCSVIGMRVRTICMGAPQHGQISGGLFFIFAIHFFGSSLNRICKY